MEYIKQQMTAHGVVKIKNRSRKATTRYMLRATFTLSHSRSQHQFSFINQSTFLYFMVLLRPPAPYLFYILDSLFQLQSKHYTKALYKSTTKTGQTKSQTSIFAFNRLQKLVFLVQSSLKTHLSRIFSLVCLSKS